MSSSFADGNVKSRLGFFHSCVWRSPECSLHTYTHTHMSWYGEEDTGLVWEGCWYGLGRILVGCCIGPGTRSWYGEKDTSLVRDCWYGECYGPGTLHRPKKESQWSSLLILPGWGIWWNVSGYGTSHHRLDDLVHCYIQSDAFHLRMHCIALPQVYMSLALSIVQHQKWLWLITRVAALGRALTIIRAWVVPSCSNSGNWCLQGLGGAGLVDNLHAVLSGQRLAFKAADSQQWAGTERKIRAWYVCVCACVCSSAERLVGH